MSKLVTAENLISIFPSALAEDENKKVLASVAAQELMELYEDNEFLALYARIDELDNSLLDILAYDFKIDWWDKSFSLTEKRETFKRCWPIKKKLGTPHACQLALSALYQDADIKEWWEYAGKPFYYKINIKTGEILPDHRKLSRIIDGVKFYKNKRSILEKIEFDIEKPTNIFVGLALQSTIKVEMVVGGASPDNNTYLTDENDALLLDEDGLYLID